MTEPIVSVVIPTRNRATLLPTAIGSALAQTMPEIEVLVVDDASEDDTPAVVKSFSDERVHYLRQPSPRGGAAARNAGIRVARGEWVAFLDDDDEWMPDKLETQVALLREGAPRVGAAYSSYVVVDRQSGQVKGRKIAERKGNLSREILARNVVGGSSSVVVRRSILEEVGLFDERLPSFQDYDLWIRVARNTEFDFVERDLLRYYIHAKKIWTDLAALTRGADLVLEKYGSSRDFRRNLAAQILGFGVLYCERGELRKGRVSLWSSIRLNPIAVRPYLNFVLSLLGARAFRAAHHVRRPRPVPAAERRVLDGSAGSVR